MTSLGGGNRESASPPKLWREVNDRLEQRRRGRRLDEVNRSLLTGDFLEVIDAAGLSDDLADFPVVWEPVDGPALELGRDFYLVEHTDGDGVEGLAVLYYPERGEVGLRSVETFDDIVEAIIGLGPR